MNRDAVALLQGLAGEHPDVAVVVSGNIGPRGDGYNPSEHLTPEIAQRYHRAQVESFAAAGADGVTMLTATHTGEPIGVVRAAVAAEIPVVIAFTVETDGRLPSGQPLHFGINCAHPDHFIDALKAGPVATGRIELLRANATRASHAELDAAEELDDGDPVELASLYASLRESHPTVRVLGGCCGTDARHVEAIARACITTT